MLRIALLSMIEPAGTGQALPRAFLRVGGKTIAQHQLDIVRILGCERVICLVRSVGPEVVALQHDAERSGLSFHVASGVHDLSRLVSANDELFSFTDGLLVPASEAAELLENGQGVSVQPAEPGVAAGFERIDANLASAGLLRFPGRLIEGLTVLPPDCDIPSALTRIALQAGVRTREVPAVELARGRWRLIRSETEAYAADGEWLAQRMDNGRGFAPGRAIARFGVLAFGSSLLDTGGASRALALAAAACLVLALGAAWLGAVALGFLFSAIAWIFSQATEIMVELELSPADSANDRAGIGMVLGWAVDLCLVVLCVLEAGSLSWNALPSVAFAPLMMILLARILAQLLQGNPGYLARDRAILGLFLAIASALGLLSGAVMVLALVLAVAALAISTEKRG